MAIAIVIIWTCDLPIPDTVQVAPLGRLSTRNIRFFGVPGMEPFTFITILKWRGPFRMPFFSRNMAFESIAVSNISISGFMLLSSIFWAKALTRSGEFAFTLDRSEERRVGKECRSRCAPVQYT